MRIKIAFLIALFVVLAAISGCSRQHAQLSSAETASSDTRQSRQKTLEPKKAEKEFVNVKGLHVTGWIAGGKNGFAHLVKLCNTTELNALVIDIKDSDGIVSYDTAVPLERKIQASSHAIPDIDAIMKQMDDNNIYSVARIAVFKDPILAKKNPKLAVLRAGGGIWTDRHGTGWANPYDKQVWDYNIAIAKDAIKHGFKEIQWDYVRFPSDGNVKSTVYPGKTQQTESQVIESFLKYAHDQLEPYNVVVSADLFGLTSLVHHDMGIGQTIKLIAPHVDYICPMDYPSHYAHGEYGIPNPDVQPYKIVKLSLGDAVKAVEGTKCKVRPWLQDFSLYSHYGKAEVLAQRKAAEELGITSFMLWNPRVKYTEAALAPEKPDARVKTAKAIEKQ